MTPSKGLFLSNISLEFSGSEINAMCLAHFLQMHKDIINEDFGKALVYYCFMK